MSDPSHSAIPSQLNPHLEPTDQGVILLPPVAGLTHFDLTRWLFWRELSQRSLAGHPSWERYVEHAPSMWPDDPSALEACLIEALDQARGGTLAVGGGWSKRITQKRLQKLSTVVKVRLMLADLTAEPVRLSSNADRQWADEVRTLAGAFFVATDPGLEAPRRTLLSYARQGESALIVGADGTGRRTLATWIARDASGAPVHFARPGEESQASMSADHAWVFEDLGPQSGPMVPVIKALLAERAHLSGLERSLDQSQALVAATGSRLESTDAQENRWAPVFGTRDPVLLGRLQRALVGLRDDMAPVLLGERGVGKSTLAFALHQALREGNEGQGSRRPFKTCDLGSLSRDLLEAELFGVSSGAATGVKARDGLFCSAGDGTLFLDELGILPLEAQSRLLRVLQDRKLRKVGSDRDEDVHASLILATNANLHAEVRAGRFRPDLLDRVSGLMIVVPPLRERPADILPIARRYFVASDAPLEGDEGWITEEAKRILLAWAWPGNVRELQQAMTSARAEAQLRGERRLDAHLLGKLAPARRRPGPLLCTLARRDLGSLSTFTTLEQRQLCAVTVELPRLQERGTRADPHRSTRHAVLCTLDGRPIHQDALEALAQLRWPGDLAELTRTVRVLQDGASGPLTLRQVGEALPLLLQGAQLQGIYALLQPSIDEHGRLRGAEQDFNESAILLGRGGEWAQIRAHAEAAADTPLMERLAATRRLAEDGAIGVLNLPPTPGLSRASALVTRRGTELWAHAFEVQGLEIWGAPLADNRRPEHVRPGAPLLLGGAGLLQLRVLGEELPTVQLIVATGRRAANGLAELAASLLGQAGQGKTIIVGGKPPPEKPPPERPTIGAPELDPPERKVLNEIVLSYDGEDHFKTYLLKAAKRRRDEPEMVKALQYLTSNDNATQQCFRLYDAPHNKLLASECAALAEADPRALAALKLLPDRLRGVIVAYLPESRRAGEIEGAT